MASESRPPFPPFTEETARKKVKAAQDAWNTKFVGPPSLPCTSPTSIRQGKEGGNPREAGLVINQATSETPPP